MRITALHTYPVKGCRRIDHDEARIEPHGLAGDRRWIVIDPDGVGITQRAAPALSLLRATPDGVGITQRTAPALSPLRAAPAPGGLTLRAPGMPDRHVTEPVDGPAVAVRVFRNQPPAPARLADDDGWTATYLDRPARLAWQADPTGRDVQGHARHDHPVSFADGHPVLIASTASLAAVADWLAEAGDDPVPMSRFRPNLVMSGAAPWAEDDWPGRRLRIGDVTFRATQPCDRCLVTTIDQDTGNKEAQPLKILGRHRNRPGGLMFGIHLIPDLPAGSTAVIRRGDEVRIHP